MLQEVIDRLKAQVSTLRLIEGAAEFAALSERGSPQTPAAYVVPLAESAEANPLSSGVSQLVTERFGAILAFRHVGDPRGEAATKQIETLRAATIAALLNWAPTANHTAVEYAGGRLLGLADGIVWWQQDFTTSRLERVV